jgi:hypothetical protein
MRPLREWLDRLWSTIRPKRRDAELERELRLHLELAAEEERCCSQWARSIRRPISPCRCCS